MARNKIVSITEGLEKPEQPQVGGAIRVSLEVEAKVVGDTGLLPHERRALQQYADGNPHSIGFQECAFLTQAETTYWIASDSSVGVLEAAAAMPDDALCMFSSFEELTAVTREWPMRVLVKVWNQLPDQSSVARFENRRIALQRLWRELQKLPAQTPSNTKRGQRKIRQKSVMPSKTQCMVDLLKTPGGATLAELTGASGWQAHTVRAFLSRKVSKQLGLPLQSFRREGQRVYALPPAVAEPTSEAPEQTREGA